MSNQTVSEPATETPPGAAQDVSRKAPVFPKRRMVIQVTTPWRTRTERIEAEEAEKVLQRNREAVLSR